MILFAPLSLQLPCYWSIFSLDGIAWAQQSYEDFMSSADLSGGHIHVKSRVQQSIRYVMNVSLDPAPAPDSESIRSVVSILRRADLTCSMLVSTVVTSHPLCVDAAFPNLLTGQPNLATREAWSSVSLCHFSKYSFTLDCGGLVQLRPPTRLSGDHELTFDSIAYDNNDQESSPSSRTYCTTWLAAPILRAYQQRARLAY
nr:hypothetical protein CFP56_09724 [Quercus suber]